MLNVVFVDDEHEVLNGLRRRLRSMRHEWDITFCDNGQAVLEHLETQPIDVLVSDIRMPEMSGLQLLLQLKETHPQIVRLALSGDADGETELKCTAAAHQFIAKPVDVDTIKTVIGRTKCFRELLRNQELQAVLGGIDSLPSLPNLYQRFTTEAEKVDGTLAKAASVISEDVAMSAKILQLVNSSFFGIPKQIGSIEQAATLLGLSILRALLLSEKVFEESADAQLGGLDLVQFAEKSRHTASFASAIAKACELSRKEADDVLMAASLRNIGQLVLASSFPERYKKVYCAIDQHTCLIDAEKEEFGVCHSMVGAYLLGLWGLPLEIIESVLRHTEFSSSDTKTLTTDKCIQLAIYLLQASEKGASKEEMTEYLSNFSSPADLETALQVLEKFGT